MLSGQLSGLTYQSSFEDLAQYAINKYYLIPFPGKEDKRPEEVNRYFHGGVHVASTVNNLEICIDLYKKHAEDLLTIGGRKLSNEEIKLLKLAAIYHDAGNTKESHDQESVHAELFIKDMLALGFSEEYVRAIADAMQRKDGDVHEGKKFISAALKEQQVRQKNIYQKLLQSADCLDVIRVVRKMFDVKQMDLFYDLHERGALEELDQIIKIQLKFLDNFNISNSSSSELHRLCELSPNCYLTIKNLYAIYKNQSENNVDLLAFVKALIREQLIEKTSILKEYESGIIVRMIESTQTEMKVVKENNEILARHHLKTKAALKNYLAEQEAGYTKVYTPDDLHWRPATLLKKGVPIPLYGKKSEKKRAFVIILPNDPATRAVYFYKKNVISNAARSGDFTYTRTVVGRAKDKENTQNLSTKLDEMNLRRVGLQDDPGLHYYGKNEVEMGEILLAGYENIAGIGVADFDQNSAIEALKIDVEYKVGNIKFYRYSPKDGMTEISREEVQAQAAGAFKDKETSEQAESLFDKTISADIASIKNLRKRPINLDDKEVVGFEYDYQEHHYRSYVQKGVPVIETSNAQTSPSCALPLIAEKYYREELERLAKNNFASNALRFELIRKNGKILLVVKIQTSFPISDYDHSFLAKLLNQFGNFTVSKFNQNPNELILTTPNLSLIENLKQAELASKFTSTIQQYVESGNFQPKLPERKKIHGAKYPRIKPETSSNNANNNLLNNNEPTTTTVIEDTNRKQQMHKVQQHMVNNGNASISSLQNTRDNAGDIIMQEAENAENQSGSALSFFFYPNKHQKLSEGDGLRAEIETETIIRKEMLRAYIREIANYAVIKRNADNSVATAYLLTNESKLCKPSSIQTLTFSGDESDESIIKSLKATYQLQEVRLLSNLLNEHTVAMVGSAKTRLGFDT